MNLHMPATRVGVDKTISEADPADYDGLLLPGGFINPDLLRQSAEARQFVRAFADSDKPIATLCHGPWVLASAGLLDGRTLTSWPGIRDDLVNCGATWLDRERRQGRKPRHQPRAPGHDVLHPRHARPLRGHRAAATDRSPGQGPIRN